MVIFFFVVGLEIKREFVMGELADKRKAALPLAAALGGMVFPAGIYLALQWGEPAARGWGIPMATDIAFVVGVLALMGSRVPQGLRVLMLTLAIADDIGAVMVIAVGYTESISGSALAVALVGFGLVSLMNKLGVRKVPAYVAVGIVIWIATEHSGVHATVAGVILGLMTPARPWMERPRFHDLMGEVAQHLGGNYRPGLPITDTELLHDLGVAARESVSPQGRLERLLHPWVAFLIMPLFALANAGVHIDPSHLGDGVQIAVAAGLVIGKPIGIVLFSLVFVRMGIARLPSGVTWPAVVGGGFLGGIGFTMALFIGGLALEGPLLDSAKIGILGASLLAGSVGMAILAVVLPKGPTAAKPEAQGTSTS
jgi:NhaA family Na+:H+ antiporter